MHEIKESRFLPRWARAEGASRALIGDMPDIGFVPDPRPSIPARVVSKADVSGLSFPSLASIAKTLQNVINCVAYELAYGYDPAFSDLRKIAPNSEVAKLARLHADPFQTGSVVIPGELDDVSQEFNGRKVSALDVVSRFVDVAEGVVREGPSFETSPAVLQSLEDFKEVLNRDVEYVEFSPPVLEIRQSKSPIVVNPAFVSEVTNARRARSRLKVEYGNLEGKFRAVDTTDKKIKIELTGNGLIVSGSYPEILQERVSRSIFHTAIFSGKIRYRDDKPRHIDITHINFHSI